MPTIEEELKELQTKIAKLEKPQRDRWDRLQILATLLVPLAIAYGANRFTSEMKQPK